VITGNIGKLRDKKEAVWFGKRGFKTVALYQERDHRYRERDLFHTEKDFKIKTG
jgi:hypothetical protein